MAKFTNKPVAMAVGAAFFASAAPQLVNADTNPFSATPLNSGYDLANHAGHPEGKCGEGKCGEGKCGGKKADKPSKDTNGDGVVSKREFMAYSKAKFAKLDANGDGKLTEDEARPKRCDHHGKKGDHKGDASLGVKASLSAKASEGKCGEGKCGEGKCGS